MSWVLVSAIRWASVAAEAAASCAESRAVPAAARAAVAPARATSAWVVARSARVAEARNTSYWPSSAVVALLSVVCRSITVPMPSASVKAARPLRLGPSS